MTRSGRTAATRSGFLAMARRSESAFRATGVPGWLLALFFCAAVCLPSAVPTNVQAAPSSMTLGFYEAAGGDLAQLVSRLDQVTALAPTGAHLTADGSLQVTGDEQTIVGVAHSKGVRVYPVVQNYRDGGFRPEDLKQLASPSGRHVLAAEMVRAVVDADADGINLDLEELPPSARANYVSFVREVGGLLHPMGKKVLIDLPVNHASYDAAGLAAAGDWLLLMAYDQHNLPGRPGAVAAYGWVKDSLARLRQEVPAAKIILGLAGYGYDWSGNTVKPVSFREAMNLSGKAEAIQWDPISSEPWFAYSSSDGIRHTVWFKDAPSLQPLLREAESAGLAGVSLWRVGLEDPGFWNLAGDHGQRKLEAVTSEVSVGALRAGQGEVAQVSQTQQPGQRDVVWDSGHQRVIAERYLSLPRPPQIGTTGPGSGTVALTFDDGPDPRWTPQVLDILRTYHAHATFFVVGSHAAQYPELLARMYAEGHEVANHSYTHPVGLEHAPDWRFSLELSATQRVIEGATGHSATLFRYPYMTSLAEPQDSDEAVIERAAGLGYRLVGQASDTADWARPGTEQIVGRALNQPSQRVILLHDGGGDRSQTVAALPAILQGLSAQGLRPVGVGEAIGDSRPETMPAASSPNIALGFVLLGSAWLGVHGVELWLVVVKVVLLLVFARILLLGVLGLLHWTLAARRRRPGYEGPVTALVPAHNEETVIRRTLAALLESDYPQLEIIVIDDGSEDGTARLAEAYAERGVRLIRQPKSGKASAVRAGFAAAQHPIVVALDADTLFRPSTVRNLVKPFGSKRVGAVAGNPKVGNRVNMLTWFQVVEYVLTLNLERRAYALLGCVPVVPGAVGAWRRDAVIEVGGFTKATLAEDTDVTLALGRKGYHVTYAPDAVAFTEAPQTLAGLSRQRSRWAFGMLQCLWKHRRATLSPRAGALGWIALPGMWSVQLILPLIAPTIDLSLVLSPFVAWAPQILVATAAYNLALVILAAWALAIDREPVVLALLVPLQNLFYRQFLYLMALKAVVRAFRGVRVGWNPVARSGTSTLTPDGPFSVS